MNTKQVTKTEICKAFIEEADRVTDLMLALKAFCNHVISEEYMKEEAGEYRGDGANDPDNHPLNRFKRVPVSKVIFDEVLIPAERRANQNHLISTSDVATSIKETMKVAENCSPKSEEHPDCPDCNGDCEHCDYSIPKEELFKRFGVTPEFLDFLLHLR